MGVSCPPCTKNFERFLLLVADLVFFAPTFDLWLFFVIFADIVLMLGEKSGKPALLTLWLVIFFINIVGLFLMWVALGISIYLVRTYLITGIPRFTMLMWGHIEIMQRVKNV